jgi:hypothetical protein
MKSPRLPILATLALTLALLPVNSLAQGSGMNPESRVARLDGAVALTDDQRARATEIFQKETDAINRLTPPERPVKTMDLRQATMTQVRALLTPAQRKIYDFTPQIRGGGLTMMAPENEVARLHAAVSLTTEQQAAAMGIFTAQIAGLMDIPPADRALKGMAIRQGTRAQVRALLTPEQQAKYDATPQINGGGQKVNPANLAERLDLVVNLSDEQTRQVAAIFMQESTDLQPLTPTEQPTKGHDIRQAAKAQVRALLTPEQQSKLDANPNGLEDLEERAYVEKFLRSSPAVAARVGVVTRLSVSQSSTTSRAGAPISSGSLGYRIVGSTGTEMLKVYWERPLPTAPIAIVRLETSDGTAIQL